MSAFTYERDLDHPLSVEVEQTIRNVLEDLLSSPGLNGVLLNPGLAHDGDSVMLVHPKFRLVEPDVDPSLLIQTTISARRALWKIWQPRYPHLRYDFHDDQRILVKESW